MNNVFSKRPWLWVIIGFTVLIGSWMILFKLALGNPPASYDPRKGETYPEGVVPGSGHPAVRASQETVGGDSADVPAKDEEGRP